ncbi:BamA/TamA family outer membrane protein [Rubrivirga sp.]|uniref:BamA/TamA family outer membrane protein n=1 Tax=Rubrivirga sp. TaxID=1885344 RepID=UPI003C788709
MRRKLRSVVAALGVAASLVAPNAQSVVVVGPDSTWTEAAASTGNALARLVDRGHLSARLDSTVRDTAYVLEGPVARVQSIEVVGGPDVVLEWETLEGEPFSASALRRDLETYASALARLGYADAVVTPVLEVDASQVAVTVQVATGAALEVVGAEVAGGRSPARSYVSRRTGLSAPRAVADVDLEGVRRSLVATGLYLEVGSPVIARDRDGSLVVQVPVVEAPPGLFDVVLGYLPPAGTAGGSVVGTGRVDLRSPFGDGRTASVEIERTPGLASTFGAHVADPFVFGTPLGLGAAFSGESRDSTLSRQRLALEATYSIEVGIDVVATLARESVRPGTFGAREVEGVPKIRRSDDVLFGAGLVVSRVDGLVSPRRGLTLSVLAEQGRRASSETFAASSERRRLSSRVRTYVPLSLRQTAVVGLDATVTQAPAGADGLTDEGDLLRLGGASSFRGYDEDQWLARSFGRAVLEYRFRFDEVSYAFAFADVGGFDRPATPGLEGERRTLAGYGSGLQLRTGLGVATLTYALNPDLGLSEGKIHVGLRVGL